MRLGLMCAIMVGLAAPPALAGPWTRASGSGLLILSSGYKAAPVGALAGRPADRTEQQANIFLEYGLTGSTTIGLSAFGKYTTPDAGTELRIGGHVRQRLWSGDAGDVLSVQVEAEFPAERWLGGDLNGPRPFSATEIGGRLMYGRGWQSAWGNSFVGLEAGGETRAEGLPDEIEVTLTAGHRPFRHLLAVVALRSEIPIEAPDTAQIKVAPTLAWTFWPLLGRNDKKPKGPLNPTTLALGAEYDVNNPDQGLLVGFSIWKTF